MAREAIARLSEGEGDGDADPGAVPWQDTREDSIELPIRLHGGVTVREEHAAAALEVMSRFAVDYLVTGASALARRTRAMSAS